MLFNYKALDPTGVKKEGQIDAVNIDIAINSIQKRGLIISSIVPADKPSFMQKIPLFNRVAMKDIVILSRQMATLFEAQVSALRVFKLLASQIENAALRRAMNMISDDLQEGSPISKALARHPRIFSEFYVNMVKSGEESGRLDQTFGFLADYLERQNEVTSKAKHALVYPAFVIATFIAVMVMMLTVVIPKITPILKDSNVELPIYTKAVIFISDFTLNYGFLFAGVLVVFVVGFSRYIKGLSGKTSFDDFKLGIPYVGNLYKKLYLSRIADNMNIMILSGISMIQALETTANVVGNEIYKGILLESLSQVRGGKSLSAALSDYPLIPGIMTQMIKVGEETGELGNILKTLGKFYQREVITAVDTLVDLIEPAMIILLGLGVGSLLAAVLMPIYNLAGSF